MINFLQGMYDLQLWVWMSWPTSKKFFYHPAERITVKMKVGCLFFNQNGWKKQPSDFWLIAAILHPSHHWNLPWSQSSDFTTLDLLEGFVPAIQIEAFLLWRIQVKRGNFSHKIMNKKSNPPQTICIFKWFMFLNELIECFYWTLCSKQIKHLTSSVGCPPLARGIRNFQYWLFNKHCCISNT